MNWSKKLFWKALRRLYYLSFQIIETILNNFLGSPVKSVMKIRNPKYIYEDYKSILNGQVLYPLIRIGSDLDGGYWVPDALTDIEACFSPGYGGTKTFEDHLDLLGIESYICDPTFNEILELSERQKFRNVRLASQSIIMENKINLSDWLKLEGFETSNNLILQMDIEGAEYDILNHASHDTISQFKIIVIELHNLDSLFISDNFSELFNHCINKLKRNHTLVNCDVNNAGGFHSYKFKKFPKVIELSFLRKDSFSNEKYVGNTLLANKTSLNVLERKSFDFPTL